MARASRRKVSLHTAPSPQDIPWSPEEEARIANLVRATLDGTPGSWEVTLIFSGVLSCTWVVECQRVEDGRGLRMLVDSRRHEDRAALRAAVDSLDTRPRCRKEESWPPVPPA
jgi:hypothetical protein